MPFALGVPVAMGALGNVIDVNNGERIEMN